MTIEEAKTAISEGRKVTHRYFTNDEYLFKDENGLTRAEDGCLVTREFWHLRCSPEWQTDWELFNENDK
jgi:hypothetical protein